MKNGKKERQRQQSHTEEKKPRCILKMQGEERRQQIDLESFCCCSIAGCSLIYSVLFTQFFSSVVLVVVDLPFLPLIKLSGQMNLSSTLLLATLSLSLCVSYDDGTTTIPICIVTVSKCSQRLSKLTVNLQPKRNNHKKNVRCLFIVNYPLL